MRSRISPAILRISEPTSPAAIAETRFVPCVSVTAPVSDIERPPGSFDDNCRLGRAPALQNPIRAEQSNRSVVHIESGRVVGFLTKDQEVAIGIADSEFPPAVRINLRPPLDREARNELAMQGADVRDLDAQLSRPLGQARGACF